MTDAVLSRVHSETLAHALVPCAPLRRHLRALFLCDRVQTPVIGDTLEFVGAGIGEREFGTFE
jgi:hypothetical protein